MSSPGLLAGAVPEAWEPWPLPAAHMPRRGKWRPQAWAVEPAASWLPRARSHQLCRFGFQQGGPAGQRALHVGRPQRARGVRDHRRPLGAGGESTALMPIRPGWRTPGGLSPKCRQHRPDVEVLGASPSPVPRPGGRAERGAFLGPPGGLRAGCGSVGAPQWGEAGASAPPLAPPSSAFLLCLRLAEPNWKPPGRGCGFLVSLRGRGRILTRLLSTRGDRLPGLRPRQLQLGLSFPVGLPGGGLDPWSPARVALAVVTGAQGQPGSRKREGLVPACPLLGLVGPASVSPPCHVPSTTADTRQPHGGRGRLSHPGPSVGWACCSSSSVA